MLPGDPYPKDRTSSTSVAFAKMFFPEVASPMLRLAFYAADESACGFEVKAPLDLPSDDSPDQCRLRSSLCSSATPQSLALRLRETNCECRIHDGRLRFVRQIARRFPISTIALSESTVDNQSPGVWDKTERWQWTQATHSNCWKRSRDYG